MFSGSVLLLTLSGFITTVSGSCHPYSGPAGDTECVELSGYKGYQWATCLTDTYIQIKSKYRHECHGSPFTRYCYYQCMCEVYDQCDGPFVKGSCSCDPHNTDTGSVVPLPTWCFSPDGTSCPWYNDCLKRRYPCEGTGVPNAVAYAKNFCDLYADYRLSFSSAGRAWIDSVRTCLQIELVPILRSWESLVITCTSIKDMAFASHPKCYSVSSFCSLSFIDQMRIFWTVKGGFTDSFVDTMKSFWEIMFGCLKQLTTSVALIDNKLARVEVVMKKQTTMESNPDLFAGQVVDAIALAQKWATDGLAWYGVSKESKISTEFSVDIILVQKRDFDLNANSFPATNLSDAVASLGNSINGSLACLKVNDVHVDSLSMTACNDINCDSAFLEVTAPLAPKCTGSSSTVSGSLLLSIGLVILSINVV